MKYCSQCGHQNNDALWACEACGSRFAVLIPEKVESTKVGHAHNPGRGNLRWGAALPQDTAAQETFPPVATSFTGEADMLERVQSVTTTQGSNRNKMNSCLLVIALVTGVIVISAIRLTGMTGIIGELTSIMGRIGEVLHPGFDALCAISILSPWISVIGFGIVLLVITIRNRDKLGGLHWLICLLILVLGYFSFDEYTSRIKDVFFSHLSFDERVRYILTSLSVQIAFGIGICKATSREAGKTIIRVFVTLVCLFTCCFYIFVNGPLFRLNNPFPIDW